MTKLWARLYLWWNGWCVKHIKNKATWNERERKYGCPDCQALKGEAVQKRQHKKFQRHNERLQRAVGILRGKQR